MPIKNLADAFSKKCRWSNHRHHVDQDDDFDNGGEKEPYAKEKPDNESNGQPAKNHRVDNGDCLPPINTAFLS